MPKIVDHELRRSEIIKATWRLIAKKGIEGTTMREIAKEAGYANGALRHYFANKHELLTQAYAHVFDATNRRFGANGQGLTGVAALTALCAEVMPLDNERVLEARIVLPFWEIAINNPNLAKLNNESLDQWQQQIEQFLRQAVAESEIPSSLNIPAAAAELMSMMMGMQVMAVLNPEHSTPDALSAQFDRYLSSIGAITDRD